MAIFLHPHESKKLKIQFFGSCESRHFYKSLKLNISTQGDNFQVKA